MAEWIERLAFGAADSGILSGRVELMTLKWVYYSQLFCLTFSIKETVKNKPARLLVCRWERH